VSGPGQDDVAFQIARLELLQGIEAVSEEERRRAYETLAPYQSGWPATATRAYEVMANRGGVVASVADLLMAELDIRLGADLWARVAGFDPDLFLQAAGLWWSPSARWFYRGAELLEPAQVTVPVQDGDDFAVLANDLLILGAEGLAAFYLSVGQGAARALRRIPRRRKTARADVALIGELARQRMGRMLDGPGADGRYFASAVAPTRSEIEDSLGRRKRPKVRRQRDEEKEETTAQNPGPATPA
jgi:hypothetical protein